MKLHLRGFEKISSYVLENITLPKRNTEHSAGYDIEIAKELVIFPKQIAFAETGLKAYMQEQEVLHIYARSSLAKKKSLILPNAVGIIDSDYYNNADNEGHILILLYNFGEEVVTLQKGERIVQGVFSAFLKADEEGLQGAKRLGGFGSTGF